MTLLDLQPKEVWRYFDEISRIPRGSGNEAAVRKHIIEFAKANGLYYNVDGVGNLILRKAGDAKKGKMLLFQAHMDMVCEKNSNVEHDFTKDPIKTIVSGDTVKADGTTLGGDDGIGVAMIMALMTDKTIERPIEALLTVSEEVGLKGAMGLKSGELESDTMINLDSEDDEEIIIGCAGGMDTLLWLDIEKENVPYKPFAVKIKVSGLKGGHSGEDIHKPRANANKLIGGFLKDVIAKGKIDMRIAGIHGGDKRNAIPREAEAVIVVPWVDKENIRIAWNIFESKAEELFKRDEPDMRLTLESTTISGDTYSKKLTEKIANILCAAPHGVIEWSASIPDMVEVSTNLAYIREADGKLVIGTSQRSPSQEKCSAIASKVAKIGEQYGATAIHEDSYPGWEPKQDSALQKTAAATYKEMFGMEPKIKAIHAGLECGLFLQPYPNMDMISIGPKITDIHSPAETMHISTVEKCWKFVKKLTSVLP